MAYYTDPWDLPVSQMRRELARHTDTTLAQRYHVSRVTIWRIRKVLGVAPKPTGRQLQQREDASWQRPSA